ncbi:MAG: hypothetical protein NTW86_16990 [Candidatus Sumerlaeota bacterium]|nr:hypothetical protein [Candidatus Sumerlaeota bacterium]
MAAESKPSPAPEPRARRLRLIASLDRWALVAGAALLAVLIFTSARANIAADSVDYYGMLQWVTPAHERPIVGNLHFAEQRSPGYSLAALLPYAFLSLAVEPFVTTQQVTDAGPSSPPSPPSPDSPSTFGKAPPSRNAPLGAEKALPSDAGKLPPPSLGKSPPSQKLPPGFGKAPLPRAPLPGAKAPPPQRAAPGSKGPGRALIPPVPLLLREVPFKDFYLPRDGSWYQWKLALSLAITSYLFLFAGMAAIAWGLRSKYRELPGYALAAISIFTAPIFLRNILQTPLYATLTAYGASALFALFFVQGLASGRPRDQLAAGFFLGFLCLTRLETGAMAAALGALLLLRREWSALLRIALAASWALGVWMLYNLTRFGTPIYLGILQEDINLVKIDARYIADCLVRPSSGVLFWSPLLAPGIIGLLASRSASLRMLGVCSLALIAVCVVRVPVMYYRIGQGPLDIGGLSVRSPATMEAMRALTRSDINRYLVVLTPFAVLGLRDGIERLWERRTRGLRKLAEGLTHGQTGHFERVLLGGVPLARRRLFCHSISHKT